MNDDVLLDNLPETANMILNVLWNYNRKMTVPELTEKVNEQYGKSWTKDHIKQFANLLVSSDYVEKKHRGLKTYYIALGADCEIVNEDK